MWHMYYICVTFVTRLKGFLWVVSSLSGFYISLWFWLAGGLIWGCNEVLRLGPCSCVSFRLSLCIPLKIAISKNACWVPFSFGGCRFKLVGVLLQALLLVFCLFCRFLCLFRCFFCLFYRFRLLFCNKPIPLYKYFY